MTMSQEFNDDRPVPTFEELAAEVAGWTGVFQRAQDGFAQAQHRMDDIEAHLDEVDARFPDFPDVFFDWLVGVAGTYYIRPGQLVVIMRNTALLQDFLALWLYWREAYSPRGTGQARCNWHDQLVQILNRLDWWQARRNAAQDTVGDSLADTVQAELHQAVPVTAPEAAAYNQPRG
jgi:hypothetical protein